MLCRVRRTFSRQLGFDALDERQKYVALISGIQISGKIHENIDIHLLSEYLTGELSSYNVRPTSNFKQLIVGSN